MNATSDALWEQWKHAVLSQIRDQIREFLEERYPDLSDEVIQAGLCGKEPAPRELAHVIRRARNCCHRRASDLLQAANFDEILERTLRRDVREILEVVFRPGEIAHWSPEEWNVHLLADHREKVNGRLHAFFLAISGQRKR